MLSTEDSYKKARLTLTNQISIISRPMINYPYNSKTYTITHVTHWLHLFHCNVIIMIIVLAVSARQMSNNILWIYQRKQQNKLE